MPTSLPESALNKLTRYLVRAMLSTVAGFVVLLILGNRANSAATVSSAALLTQVAGFVAIGTLCAWLTAVWMLVALPWNHGLQAIKTVAWPVSLIGVILIFIATLVLALLYIVTAIAYV